MKLIFFASVTIALHLGQVGLVQLFFKMFQHISHTQYSKQGMSNSSGSSSHNEHWPNDRDDCDDDADDDADDDDGVGDGIRPISSSSDFSSSSLSMYAFMYVTSNKPKSSELC